MPQHLAGEQTHFVEKIWTGHPFRVEDWDKDYSREYYEKFGWLKQGIMPLPKLHTIRFMTPKRAEQWEGKMIDFFINSRTQKQFRFAPRVECKSVQRLTFEPILITEYTNFPYEEIIARVDGSYVEFEKLAINDGFNSVEDFFSYFNEERINKIAKHGKFPYIIHWTDLRY